MKTCLSKTSTKLCVLWVFAFSIVGLTGETTQAIEAHAVKAGETAGFRNMGDSSQVKATGGAGFRNMGGADSVKPVGPDNSGVLQAPVVHTPVSVAGAVTPGYTASKCNGVSSVTLKANAPDLKPATFGPPHSRVNTLGVPDVGMPLTLVTLDASRSGSSQNGAEMISSLSKADIAPGGGIPSQIHALDLY